MCVFVYTLKRCNNEHRVHFLYDPLNRIKQIAQKIKKIYALPWRGVEKKIDNENNNVILL